MTTNETYNGWTNYPTWNVALWEDRDGRAEQAQEFYDNSEPTEFSTRLEVARMDLAAAMKEEYEEGTANVQTTGPLADILNWAMASVNWQEIAESYMDDIEEEEE